MPNYCHLCSRKKHSGLCDMAELSDGTTVHVSRLDNPESELAKLIESGKVKVVNRWKKDWIGLESNESS
jgi:hypothetical protein